MTSRDDLIATVHQMQIDNGIATEVNLAVRNRLLKGLLRRLIEGQPKHTIVLWLNAEHEKLDKDVRCEAITVYNMIKDVKL